MSATIENSWDIQVSQKNAKGSGAESSREGVEVASYALAKAPPLTLEAVYRLHAKSVARWAGRLGGPDADVEDLVHEVFLVVRDRLDGFRNEARITTWLYRITHNVVRHRRRKDRLKRWLFGDPAEIDQVASSEPLQDEQLEQLEAVRTVYRVLDRMSEKYRTVLILHELEGLSGPEIAAVSGVKPSTVWVRLHRAREQFQKRLEQDQRRGG